MMVNRKSITPNDATLRYYFYFMSERMKMFRRKCEGVKQKEWTKDPILRNYKFTNVYRATDRVSQYLIRNIIYKDLDQYSREDVLLRILIFKIFNKPETWEYLSDKLSDPITLKTYNPKEIGSLLTEYQRQHPIFNNAYMMAGSHVSYNDFSTKHDKWLTMVKREMIEKGLFRQILDADSLETVYNLLSQCTFIGGFLAYQYAIDFNYSPYLNFSENSFVKAGIGAIRGIKKCFISYGHDYEDAIKYISDHIETLSIQYHEQGFNPLEGHAPTLIDLQNCFCETDKYLRAKMPELKVGNVRIKQHYSVHSGSIHYMFPPKWGVKETLSYEPHKELTLFEV